MAASVRDRLSHLRDEKTKISGELEKLASEYSDLRDRKIEVDKTHRSLYKQLDLLEKKKEHNDAVLQETEERLREHLEAGAEFTNLLTDYTLDSKHLQEELNRMSATVSKVNERIDAIQNNYDSCSQELNSANERISKAERISDELGVKLCDLEEEADEWSDKTIKLRTQLDLVHVSMKDD